MPSYPFPTQVAIVIATMGIHNFLRRLGVVDEAFTRAEVDEDAVEVEFSDAEDEMHSEMNAPKCNKVSVTDFGIIWHNNRDVNFLLKYSKVEMNFFLVTSLSRQPRGPAFYIYR